MADVQIRCINKTPRNDPYEGITHLGNSQGKWTRQQIIGWIEDRSHTFYTLAVSYTHLTLPTIYSV